MSRIFISYSRQDQEFAQRLANDLESWGLDVWIDQDDIIAGSKWSTAIQQGLDSSDLMLVIISPDSMASENVEDEWQYFKDQVKPLIPIMYRSTQLHFQLHRLQYIDFDEQDYEVACKQLQVTLERNGIQILLPGQNNHLSLAKAALVRGEDIVIKLKADLIAQMRSPVNEVAVNAVRQLQLHNWFTDGTLDGADLHGANLDGADLTGADLIGADMRGASLVRVRLARANLGGALLDRANLKEAVLTAAYLKGAILHNADLEGAKLDKAVFSTTTILPRGSKWSPDIDMAHFTDLCHPNFWRSDDSASPAHSAKTHIEREKLKASLIAQMGNEDNKLALNAVEQLRQQGWLEDGTLYNADLIWANLKESNLSKADLRAVSLRLANLCAADLRLVDLRGGRLDKADLRGTNLAGANLSRSELNQTKFDKDTILPDGTPWVPYIDLTRFTDPDHSEFWRSDNPNSPAYGDNSE